MKTSQSKAIDNTVFLAKTIFLSRILLQTINELDRSYFLLYHQNINHKAMIAFSRWLTHLGDGPFYLFLGLLIFALDDTSGSLFFITALLAYAMERPVYVLLKNTLKRDRPSMCFNNFKAFIIPSDKFSFPSGHSAGAFVMATLLSYFYPAYTAPAYILACLIGGSRFVLGVHFPSDILVGSLLGASFALLAIYFI